MRLKHQPLKVPTNSAQVYYLRQLAKRTILGSTAGEVARFFIIKGLEEAMGKGLIERREFKP